MTYRKHTQKKSYAIDSSLGVEIAPKIYLFIVFEDMNIGATIKTKNVCAKKTSISRVIILNRLQSK